MARPLRVEYEGAFFHVTSRGNERKEIFSSAEDYEKFKTYLYEAREKFGYKLHAYVLMTNHFHLLIETPEDRQIGYMFGGISFLAVSQSVKLFSLRLAEDRKLSKKVEVITFNLKG